MEAATQEGALPEEEAAAPAGFEIDGERYEIPTLDTLNLDEERILYIYADAVLQDFAPVHPLASDEEKLIYNSAQLRQIRNPELKRALAHIAYRRRHPEVDDAEIQSAIGLANALEVELSLIRGDEEVEEDPPAQSSQTSSSSESDVNGESSPSKQSSKSTNTGSDTESALGNLVAIPSRIGTTASGTSSESSPVTGG